MSGRPYNIHVALFMKVGPNYFRRFRDPTLRKIKNCCFIVADYNTACCRRKCQQYGCFLGDFKPSSFNGTAGQLNLKRPTPCVDRPYTPPNPHRPHPRRFETSCLVLPPWRSSAPGDSRGACIWVTAVS